MTNNVIVTKAKKDNSIIIIKEEEYGNKINQFFLHTLLKTIKIRHIVNKNEMYQIVKNGNLLIYKQTGII